MSLHYITNKAVRREVMRMISHFWSKAKRQFGVGWELLQLQCLFRRFGSDSARAGKLNVVSTITCSSSKTPGTLSQDGKLEFCKPNEMKCIIGKLKLPLRFRAKRLEEGEQFSLLVQSKSIAPRFPASISSTLMRAV